MTNSGLTVNEGANGTPITQAILEATDIDNPPSQVVYTLTSVPVNGSVRHGGILLNLGETFTQADINGGLVTYDHNGSQNPFDAFDFSVDDGSGTASSGTFNVTVVSVNNAPVAGGIESAAVNYVENTTATLTSTISFSDLDDTHFESAIVQITGGFNSGQDLLTFSDQNGIAGSYDGVNGRWTLSGTATISDYETAVRSIAYVNTSDDPDTATRTISFTVHDGQDSSNTITREIELVGVTDAPLLDNTASLDTREHRRR